MNDSAKTNDQVSITLDVLAFGAHPDDVELGCGGTMLMLRNAGLRLGIVDFTAGERGSRGTRETRAQEAATASRILGLVARETLSFSDTALLPSLELRRAAIEAIRRYRPRVVLAPLPHDVHPDHAAAGAAVRDAFYPSGMKNVEAAGEPFRATTLLHYFMHDEEATPLVVDISSVWTERVEVVRCFESQLNVAASSPSEAHPTLIARPDFIARLEARARSWGRRANVEFGDPLVVGGGGAIAIRDLAAWIS